MCRAFAYSDSMVQDPEQLAQDLATLRSLTKRLSGDMRLVKQIAARADDNMKETLQSEEDTRK